MRRTSCGESGCVDAAAADAADGKGTHEPGGSKDQGSVVMGLPPYPLPFGEQLLALEPPPPSPSPPH